MSMRTRATTMTPPTTRSGELARSITASDLFSPGSGASPVTSALAKRRRGASRVQVCSSTASSEIFHCAVNLFIQLIFRVCFDVSALTLPILLHSFSHPFFFQMPLAAPHRRGNRRVTFAASATDAPTRKRSRLATRSGERLSSLRRSARSSDSKCLVGVAAAPAATPLLSPINAQKQGEEKRARRASVVVSVDFDTSRSSPRLRKRLGGTVSDISLSLSDPNDSGEGQRF